MIVRRAVKHEDHWELSGALGDRLLLPCAISSDFPFLIGTVGTRRAVKAKGNLTERFSQTLAELDQPIMLVDTRRSGMGGSGSWGPAEFATIIPDHLKAAGITKYNYYHVPSLAPSLQLLEAWRKASKSGDELSQADIEAATKGVLDNGAEPDPAAWKHWEVFRAAYRQQVSEHDAPLAGRAFVEAARETGGIAIFLCAEERRNDFSMLNRMQQDSAYCHRFTLAKAVASAVKQDFPDAEIWRVDLAVGEPSERTRLFES